MGIMAGHFAIQLSGAGSNGSDKDPAMRQAAQTYETLYLGYCAASRTELCLTVGSMCMLVLVGTYVFDIIRSCAAMFRPPNYDSQGCQLCKAHRLMRSKTNAMYDK